MSYSSRNEDNVNFEISSSNEAVQRVNDQCAEIAIHRKEEIEEILADLERFVNRKLTKKEIELLTFIAVRNLTHKAVTKMSIQSRFRCSIDYAEKLLYCLRKKGLIISSNIRIGHMMGYFISNMRDYIPLYQLEKSVGSKSGSLDNGFDQSILLTLFKELSNNKGLFHNIQLITKLDDKKYYDFIYTGSDGLWNIPSTKNKVKNAYIRLSRFRNANLQVAPNGTVEICIGASRNPYDLHSDLGLSEFFLDLGKIIDTFQIEIRVSSPLQSFYDWNIVRFDYNYDIEGLDITYLQRGSGILQVKHLAHLYQYYIKQLPHKGLILRIEKHFNPKLHNTLKEFLDQIRDIEQS